MERERLNTSDLFPKPNLKTEYQKGRNNALVIVINSESGLNLKFPNANRININYLLLFPDEKSFLNNLYGTQGGPVLSRQEFANQLGISIFALQQRDEEIVGKLTSKTSILEKQKNLLFKRQVKATVLVLKDKPLEEPPFGLPELEKIKTKFGKLKEREKQTITLACGLNGENPMTLEEVGKILKPEIKKAAVSMILKEAFRKILGLRNLPGEWKSEEFGRLKKTTMQAIKDNNPLKLSLNVPSFNEIIARIEDLFDVQQEILARRIKGESQASIARDFKTSQSVISEIEQEIFEILFAPKT